MKIKIKLHANSSQEKIEKVFDDEYEIWLKEKPADRKANLELVKVLKKYFGREVEIISGFTSRRKIINVLDTKS